MPGLLSKIMPKEEGFYQMFVDQAENVHEGAKALVELMENYTNIERQVNRMKDIEHKGDDITHRLINKLDKSFVTPFDREDIHELSSKVDDILDLADAVAARLIVYNVAAIRPGVADLARILMDSTEQVVKAVRTLKGHKDTLKYCIEINRLENEGDRKSRALIAQLFDEEKNPVEIIKWKEIIEVLEIATDKCEDVANVIESVVLKNA